MKKLTLFVVAVAALLATTSKAECPQTVCGPRYYVAPQQRVIYYPQYYTYYTPVVQTPVVQQPVTPAPAPKLPNMPKLYPDS